MPITLPTPPTAPILGTPGFDVDAGAFLNWMKTLATTWNGNPPLIAGDGGVAGVSPQLSSNNIDSTVNGGYYFGYGGANASASAGDNPFPTYAAAFGVTVYQGGLGAAGDYVTQIASKFDITNPEMKLRSRAVAGSGWSNWQRITPERGSNVNGSFIRFADGTLICTGLMTIGPISTAVGSLFTTSAETTWTFPAGFLTGTEPVTSASTRGSQTVWANNRKALVTSSLVRVISATSIAGNLDVELSAIGRWK